MNEKSKFPWSTFELGKIFDVVMISNALHMMPKPECA